MKDCLLSRRPVLLGGASFLASSFLGTGFFGFGGSLAGAEETPLPFTELQRYSLQKALKEADEKYDPVARMITSSVSGVGYHTTLEDQTVHPTRTSFEYAVALLDSMEPQRLGRAQDILRAVIAQQDQNPDSKTYGIWSWYLEEPLEKMSPPDWNWADFCGAQLLAVWIDHHTRLDPDVAEIVHQSILHATNSIRKRNVAPGYTNIAIMGTYVTLVAADRFGWEDLQKYAKERLRIYHKFLFEQGSFSEYNSPTYSIVAIKELTRMLMHVRDEDDLKLIREIHDFAWKHATCRFHVPTRQWAGPHSRCYSTLLTDSTVAVLEFATGEKGRVTSERPIAMDLGTYRLAIQCPESCYDNFQPLTDAREIKEVFVNAHLPKFSIVGTTYLHPLYTLGTTNRGDFWNQRRPFVAYWGTKEKPTYLQIRFLHDGYDYCSAIPFTIQDRGCALTSVVFATDFGDSHPSLDPVRDATIRAKDLRLRFEFGGSLDKLMFVPFNGQAGMLFLKDRDIQMLIRPIIDLFGDDRFRWEIGQNKTQKWVDAVAYSGDEKAIDFNQIEKAFLAFALQIAPIGELPISMEEIDAEEKEGRCMVTWSHRETIDSQDIGDSLLRYQYELSVKPAMRQTMIETFQNLSVKVAG